MTNAPGRIAIAGAIVAVIMLSVVVGWLASQSLITDDESPATVLALTAEGTDGATDLWIPVNAREVELSENGYLLSVGLNLAVRLRITLLLENGSTRDAFISLSCFETLSLGDPWPPPSSFCRDAARLGID